jgi:two-component system, NarL family, nitrate/nitrite response regulator NarL
MTRVFVAAASRALRASLRARLRGPGLEVVGEGAVADAAPPDTDVIVVGDEDLGLPTGDAVPAVGARAVVVLSDDARPARTLGALALRGWAVVARDAGPAELQAAVVAAGQGFSVVPAPRASRLDPGRDPGVDISVEPLTPREREVLELLGQGLSNRRIAERLGISEHTAKFHVASLCGKLHASSRTEAVSQGLRRGLIAL